MSSDQFWHRLTTNRAAKAAPAQRHIHAVARPDILVFSVDFLIDRNMHYAPIDAEEGERIVDEGCVGRIDDRTSEALINRVTTEPRRLAIWEVFSNKLIEQNKRTTQ